MLIIVASNGSKGLKDTVSEVFARCSVFTIVKLEKDKIKEVKIEKNTMAKLDYGVGPIVSQKLIDAGANVVIAAQFGPTVQEIFKKANVETFIVPSGTIIEDAIKQYINSRKILEK
jgi:predicted Fe-Mo cluster-binding NifX family protein